VSLFRSLRSQIFLPFAALIVTAILGLGVWLATRTFSQQKTQLGLRLGGLVQTVALSKFPLNQSVCEQLKGLTGAEFALRDNVGVQIASTLSGANLPTGPQAVSLGEGKGLLFDFEIVWRVGERDFYWSKVKLPSRTEPPLANELNVLFPSSDLEQLRRKALWPTVGIASGASVLAILLAAALAQRITKPLSQVRSQISRLAEGDMATRLGFERTDELGLLGADVDTLAERLTNFESTIRRMERIRALGMLSGGLVHQLRNSATGARLAIDIHRESCPLGATDESLEVAGRQLQLMDRFIQKFLKLGERKHASDEQLDLATLIAATISLVMPFARHHQVNMVFQTPSSEFMIRGDRESMEDLLLNLWLNAIEAVATKPLDGGDRTVTTELTKAQGRILLNVLDNGPGVESSVAGDLFEAFVSGKSDGAGIGLAVAREICVAHGGTIRWERRDGLTCFLVELPTAKP
jgi:signal transduction histidine kinase